MWSGFQRSSLWACFPDFSSFSFWGFLQPTPLLLPYLLLTSWGWGQLWLRCACQRKGSGFQQGQQETLDHGSTRQFPSQVIVVLIYSRAEWKCTAYRNMSREIREHKFCQITLENCGLSSAGVCTCDWYCKCSRQPSILPPPLPTPHSLILCIPALRDGLWSWGGLQMRVEMKIWERMIESERWI